MVIAISGGWDPPHIGHYKMFEAAKKYNIDKCCHNHVIAILNSDEWLMKKKGYVFMPFDERKYILESCKYIDVVVEADDRDGTVCENLSVLKPDIFGNGGDRKNDNTPEVDLCKRLGIKMVWNLGGDKIQSSSKLVDNVKQGDSNVK